MLINEVDYRINVLILLMEQEIEVTIQTVEGLLETLEEGVTVSVLLNGARSPRLQSVFSVSPAVRFYESPENLGVAGGRNFLLRTEECQSSELVIILDNDVVTPTDFVRTLATFLVRHEDAGVVGGVALDIKYSINFRTLAFHGDIGPFGNKLLKVSSAELKELVLPGLTPNKVFHAGTHPDYYYAYFSARPGIMALLSRLLRKFRIRIEADPFLARRATLIDLLQGDTPEYEVTTVAGCNQAFRRSLVEKIGYLDDRFNPYGFEDVDFCIRAKQAGLKNYIDTGTWLYHGTDLRHQERDPGLSLENAWRCRTILAANVLGSKYRRVVMKAMLIGSIIEGVFRPVKGVRRFRAKYRGFRWGQAILQGKDTQRPPVRPLTKARSTDQKHIDKIKNRALNRENVAKIESFKNKYEGERCFIIGNGPSLNEVDLTLLADEITFGVNGIFYKRDEMGFEPTFYVVEDNHVVDDNLERIREIDYSTRFFPAKYLDQIGVDERTMFLPVDWGYYFKSHPAYADPRFSTDCEQVIYAGQTVTYLNMQLAYYMGFKAVYLIGMDFSYQVPPKEEMDGLTIVSQADDLNHFHKDYFGKGKKWHDPKLENCRRAYEHAKTVFEADGRHIYNATIGGQLEVFDRVALEELFLTGVKG